jgi:formate/nitrite transporter
MKEKHYAVPSEIMNVVIEASVKKASLSKLNMVFLGVLAGAFIAFASEGSNMAAFNLFANPATYGLGKAIAGAIFGTGLMLVVIAGGELFTGNTLMVTGVLEGKISVASMLKNWAFVYIGNFIGSLLIAIMINQSGLLHSGANQLGAVTIKIATYKIGLSFMEAFVLGVMCNWLVCLAVWMAYGAQDIAGKILAVFFPIWLFITSGFEHSIANMYYIPAGILAKNNPSLSSAATALGVKAEALDNLNWSSFLLKNLIPVTLGNIVGGAVCVATIYWLVYKRKTKLHSNSAVENEILHQNYAHHNKSA